MRLWRWWLLVATVIALDLATKELAKNVLHAYEPFVLLPWFNLTLAYNEGAAFSFLSQAGGWQRWILVGFSLCMSAVLCVWLSRTNVSERRQRWGLSLILGGALGNLLDRVFFGHVTDFIQWHYHHYYWPVFNIADTAITVGAVLLLLDVLFYQSEG